MAFHNLLHRGAVALLALTSASAYGTEYFVATTGSDNNPGTAAAPFGTISAAAKKAKAGDTVTIFGGTYRETVAPQHSGKANDPIVFRAAVGHTVTISGLDVETATPIGGGKFSIPVGTSLPGGQLQIFTDGKPLPEARYPNAGPDVMRSPNAVMASATVSGNTINVLDPKLGQANGAWVGARIRYNTLASDQIASGFVFQGGVVTRSTPGNLIVASTGTPAYAFKTNENQYSLTGVAAAMDLNGEWYASGGTATLLDASRPQAAFPVEVRSRVLAIDLWHKSYVTFKNINLLGATVRTSVMSNGDVLDGVKASYFGFNDAVESGFFGGWDNFGGIQMLGNNHTVRNGVFRFAEGNGILVKGNGTVVENNVIENVGIYGVDAAAVKVYGAQNEVKNNTLANSGRHLVRFREGTGNVVSGNEIYNGGSNTSDCGGVYAWHVTEGGTISDNFFHDLEGTGVGMGAIYLDHNCNDMRVFRNVIQRTRSGIRLNTPTSGNLIVNNTIDATTTHSLRSWPDADLGDSTVVNNYFPTWINSDFSKCVWKNNVTETTTKFVSRATGDFRPTLGSPLIDAGDLLSSIMDFFLGNAPDAGALEFDLFSALMKPDYGASVKTTPTVVSNLEASGDNVSATVTWSPRPEAASYRVYRSYSLDGAFALVANSLKGTSFTDTKADRGVDTYYYVTAVNAAGESVVSEVVVAKPAFAAKGSGLAASYFSNPDLQGAPTLTRIENVDNVWGKSSPGGAVPADGFSARWEGFVEAPVTGPFRFRINSDDGYRVWVNGDLVAEDWGDGGHAEVFTMDLVAGVKYEVKMEYFENEGSATAQLMWMYPNHALSAIPANRLYQPDLPGLNATYFNTWNLDARQFSFNRVDSQINFDWGLGSPDPRIPANLFSARWTGTLVCPTAGNYTFTVYADNFVRIWINDELVIDKWVNAVGTYNGTIRLPAKGRYNIKVEYAEAGDKAAIKLGWAYPGQAYQIIPAANFKRPAP